jgi:DNA-directed RNA polymerase specialized sigma24 family protein
MASRARRDPIPGAEPARVREPMSESELESFYRSVFLPLVRRATWKHGLSPEDASDIVQDAFILAIGKIDRSGHPKSWLIQVVDHLAMNHRRKTARRAQLTSKWATPAEQSDRLSQVQLPEY